MVLKHAPTVPPCFKTASQVQPWPRQPWLWYRTRASVGRTLFVLLSLQTKTICPTYECTTPTLANLVRPWSEDLFCEVKTFLWIAATWHAL